jgi:hypothetical protein
LSEAAGFQPLEVSAMAALAPVGTDFSVIDTQITHALFALRLARVVTARERRAEDRDAEKRAEANLNALLDHRHRWQR